MGVMRSGAGRGGPSDMAKLPRPSSGPGIGPEVGPGLEVLGIFPYPLTFEVCGGITHSGPQIVLGLIPTLAWRLEPECYAEAGMGSSLADLFPGP